MCAFFVEKITVKAQNRTGRSACIAAAVTRVLKVSYDGDSPDFVQSLARSEISDLSML